MLLMLSATFTGIIITSFESALNACVILTSFIPMLSGTGGNSGSQSSVAVIRALSLDEVEFSDVLAVLWKEIRVAVLCGVCLGGANFIKMMVVDRWLMHNPEAVSYTHLDVYKRQMIKRNLPASRPPRGRSSNSPRYWCCLLYTSRCV